MSWCFPPYKQQDWLWPPYIFHHPGSTPRCTGLTPGMLVLLFLANLIGFPPEVLPERRQDDVSKNPPDQIKSSVFLLMAVNWAREWAGHGWHPRVMAGSCESGEPVCLPLLSQSALFVTRYHRLSRHRAPWPHMHLSVLAMMALLSCTYSAPQKGKHVIFPFSHGAKKAPLLLRELYSSSADRSAEPSPSFIHLSIRLPVFTPCYLSPVFTTCLYAHWGSLNGFC